MAVMSSQFPLNFKPINLKQTADTWNIRIAFLSVIQTRRHLIHLIIHARPPAVRNGNTALHKVHHTTGMTIFSEQIHVAWLSFRTQNFLSHFMSYFFFCGSFYIIRLLFSFFFQPLTIIQSAQWLGLEPASRDSIPGNDKIFIFHKASIHCDEIIAIPITSFFRFWRKS